MILSADPGTWREDMPVIIFVLREVFQNSWDFVLKFLSLSLNISIGFYKEFLELDDPDYQDILVFFQIFYWIRPE